MFSEGSHLVDLSFVFFVKQTDITPPEHNHYLTLMCSRAPYPTLTTFHPQTHNISNTQIHVTTRRSWLCPFPCLELSILLDRKSVV